MASIVTDLAKTILEKLMNNAIAESRYICCFRCIAEDLEKGKETLNAKRVTVGEHVKVANRRAEGIQSDVIFWQEQVDKLIQEEDTETNMTCCFGLCPNCKRRYSKGKDMADKIQEMRGLMERNFESVGLPPNLPDVEYHSLRDYISFKSRELKYRELLDALKDDNIYMVGLQGMGGTGKTTLAMKVGKELKQSKQFDHVIDTTVSYTPGMKKIQDDIAAPLGLTFENCSESEQRKLLWTRLTGGVEKILLILDDMWGDINFKEIGIPYSDHRKGCRVLLTTRDRSVCESMECERIIQLDVLPEEEAWILFKKHAGITGSSSKSLMENGVKIAKKCKGLPIAIAAIASSLKGKQQEEEWDVALKSLQKHVPMDDVDKNLVQVYQCLRYSYDHLNNEKAQRLFLLCSLFREDEQISVEILTRFGIGTGLFGEVHHTYDDGRREVAVTINELIYSCLLLKDKKGYVKMHDLVREVALWIANKEIQSINLCDKNKNLLVEGKQNIKYLLCECKDMDVFSCRFDGSKLEILIAAYTDGQDVKVPNSCFDNMNELRVLHLSSKKWRHSMRSLSLSIQPLTNIRSLFLERLELGDISFFGSLHSLETLDLRFCDMDELTIEITKLEKLKLLTLHDCETLKNDSIFEVIERCSSLEELYIINAYPSFWDAPQTRNLTEFQRYYLIEVFSFEINYSISKYVDLSKIDALFSEATFMYLVQTAEFLDLKEIRGEWRNLIPNIVPEDNGMNDLVKLRLIACSKLQCVIDTRQNVFSKLTTLELEEMEKLEELCSGPFPSEFLKSLETMEICKCYHLRGILFKSELNLCHLKSVKLDNCPKLISLFQLSTSRSLVLLEYLSIRDCEQLKNIIIDERTGDEPGEEIVDGEDDIKQCGSMFPNMKTLRIRGCPQLEFIFHFLSPRDFIKLESIRIANCGKLEYIFAQYKHEDHELHHEVMNVTLCSLNSIELSDLPVFIDIFPDCHHPVHLSMKKSSSKAQIQPVPFKCNAFCWTHICCYACKCRDKLRSTEIPLVSKHQQLDCSISSASNYLRLPEIAQCLSKQSQILRNIKVIYLYRISKIKSVFVLSDAPTLLVETLTVRNCDELKHIIIDIGDDLGGKTLGDIFPKLKHLRVEGCKQLEYIFGYYPHRNYQNHNDIIQLHLPVLECLNFFMLPSLIGICPDNYHITVAPLKIFELSGCSHFIIKSISDFLFQLQARELDGTNTKGLRENMTHVLTVERLQVGDQPHITYLFEGLKNSITLQNLTELEIARCEKLEVIISTSILRSLPQLHHLMIKECKELKQIIEADDVDKSNSLSLKTCFPKLKAIVVIKCNKLKCIFPASTSIELPKLDVLIIAEATMIEEVFKCQQRDHKVKLPNLKYALLVKLPSLCHDVESLTAEHRFVQNCPKLSLTSALLTSA